MKKALSVILSVMIILCAVSSLAAFASASEVSAISGLSADIVLNKDGSAKVTELWSVKYNEGSAEGFTRWIDLYSASGSNGLSVLQKFGEVKDVAVTVDGVTAKNGTSGDNTFSAVKSSDGSSFDITVNSSSAKTAKEYSISYTVTQAVKKKSGDAVFAYVLLGKSFLYTCNNVEVTVHTPSEVGKDKITVDEKADTFFESKDDSTVMYSAKRVGDVMAIEFSMPDDAFDKGELTSYSAVSQFFGNVRAVIGKIAIVIAVIIAIVLIVMYVLLPDKLRRRKLEKKISKLNKIGAKKDIEDIAKDETDNLAETTDLPAGMTACEAFVMLEPYSRISPKKTSKQIPFIFALAVLECIEKGCISVREDGLVISEPAFEIPPYMLSVLRFLKNISEKNTGIYVIDSDFRNRIAAECANNYDSITKYLTSFYALIPQTKGKFFKSAQNAARYEKTYYLKLRAKKLKSKNTYSDIISSVMGGKLTSSPEVFALMYSSTAPSKLFRNSGTDSVSCLSESIADIYDTFIKSK